MARATIILLALLVPLVMAAQQHRQRCVKPQKQSRRLSREEEDRLAEQKFPGWTTCEVNPWELSGKFEGDMLVANHSKLRHALKDPSTIWSTRRVPYRYDRFYFYAREIEEIEDAIREFNKYSCVKFQPMQDNDKDYVVFTGKDDGCCANVGKIGGAQEINLEPPACIYKRGCIFHQMMHVLGFIHEHNAPNRDNYVNIIWANIRDDKKEFFQKMDPMYISNYGYGYDYGSIMHGSRKMFSKNDYNTIEPKDPMAVTGHRQNLSSIDIERLKKHYSCS